MRNQGSDRGKQKLRETDENCLRPLNLIAPPQTDNCRGIALSGIQHSVTKHYLAWGRCLHEWLTLIQRVACSGLPPSPRYCLYLTRNCFTVDRMADRYLDLCRSLLG